MRFVLSHGLKNRVVQLVDQSDHGRDRPDGLGPVRRGGDQPDKEGKADDEADHLGQRQAEQGYHRHHDHDGRGDLVRVVDEELKALLRAFDRHWSEEGHDQRDHGGSGHHDSQYGYRVELVGHDVIHPVTTLSEHVIITQISRKVNPRIDIFAN